MTLEISQLDLSRKEGFVRFVFASLEGKAQIADFSIHLRSHIAGNKFPLYLPRISGCQERTKRGKFSPVSINHSSVISVRIAGIHFPKWKTLVESKIM